MELISVTQTSQLRNRNIPATCVCTWLSRIPSWYAINRVLIDLSRQSYSFDPSQNGCLFKEVCHRAGPKETQIAVLFIKRNQNALVRIWRAIQ
jgi:hypothetical protein